MYCIIVHDSIARKRRKFALMTSSNQAKRCIHCINTKIWEYTITLYLPKSGQIWEWGFRAFRHQRQTKIWTDMRIYYYNVFTKIWLDLRMRFPGFSSPETNENLTRSKNISYLLCIYHSKIQSDLRDPSM